MPGPGHSGFRAKRQIRSGVTPQLGHIIRAELRAFSGLDATPEEVSDEVRAHGRADTGMFARTTIAHFAQFFGIG